MHSLIDQGKRWDESCVRQCITTRDPNCILRIPIPMIEEHDKMIWTYTKDEVASVRSVYHRLREVAEGQTRTTQVVGSRLKTLWSSIWGEHTIPKIKNYMWKLASKAIAVKNNLIRLGLSHVYPDCPICGVEETSTHMTFGCSWTQAICCGMLGIRGANQASQSIEEWLIDRMTEPDNTSRR